jgi:hypothetical protein
MLTGAVQLNRLTSGVALDGHFKIDAAELSDLNLQARGKASLEVKAAAQAQSPSALISVLAGSGNLTLDAVALPAPAPSAGMGVIAAVMANKLANQPDDLATALKMSLTSSRAELGSRSIPITITGGIAKLEALTLDTPDGSVSTVTVVDLSSLSIDSAWKLAAIVPPLQPLAEPLPEWVAPPAKGPLPPASIVYTGALGDLAALSVNVDASDMQRELAVRQIERNVEELERLKRQDEYRARVELERRQGLDANRAAAAAAKAAGAYQPAPTPPPATVLPPVLPESAASTGQTSAPIAAETGGPPPQAVAPQTVTIEAAPITPAGERPAAASARPQPARNQPNRPSPTRRSSSDEVLRSLGGIP